MRTMRSASLAGWSSAITLCVLGGWGIACGASSGGSVPGPGASGAAGGAGSGGFGGFVAGEDGSVIPVDANTGVDTMCAGENFPGNRVPLDVYILLDATASMRGTEEGSQNVWPDVVKAIKGVISDPLAEGISVGLTYMPVTPSGPIPGTCSVSSPCTKGNCNLMFGICTGACTLATVAQDCGLYGPCVPNLAAPLDPSQWMCNGATVKDVSCDPMDYGNPIINIASLPGNAKALTDEIDKMYPDGGATATQPALEGGLRYATQWAKDHPTHLVNLLFATDGMPNHCTYDTIEGTAALAKTAYEAAPSVPTFVLGIGDLADLNAIAKGGGTGAAYVADKSTVAKKLLDMFNQIRAKGACQFQIPQPAPGEFPDYGKVNVAYTKLGETSETTVLYVGDESKCSATDGGWYYDDPTAQKPTKILLCPATCEGVKLSEKDVRVQLGCLTIVK